MSDLQLSLIGLGMALVLGVFAYNKWQERQHRKLAERIFRGDHPDVLLGRRQAEADALRPPAPGRLEPAIAQAGTAAGEEAQASVDAPLDAQRIAGEEPPDELADPAIDCIVRFESAQPVSAPYLWQAQQQAMGKLAHSLVWCGRNERSGAWERITANAAGDYRRLRAALQLADRRGPLNAAELTLFLNGMQRLADEFLAVVELPARDEVLARAEEIDRFCAGVDIQIGVNVVAAEAPFAGTRLRALAEAVGLTLRGDGMFHATDGAGATLFTLSNLEAVPFAADGMKTLATHGITFTLDVPRVADGARVFDRMVAMARQVASGLGGSLVDDNRAPLPDGKLALIHDKVAEVEQRMAARGLKAGGAQALRLFS